MNEIFSRDQTILQPCERVALSHNPCFPATGHDDYTGSNLVCVKMHQLPREHESPLVQDFVGLWALLIEQPLS